MGWLGSWAYRVEITIDHDDIDAGLANFPILIYIGTSSGIDGQDLTPIFDEVGANSKKIAVTESDGTTQCYVEIERWDNVTERAWLWTKVPTISSSADTIIYLYYDNAQPNNTTYVGDIESVPAQNVWDSDYKFVCHMRDKTTSSVADSTSNNNDGTKVGANQPIEAAGKIDKAQDFDGLNDKIILASQIGIVGTVYTYCFWGKVDTLSRVFMGRLGDINAYWAFITATNIYHKCNTCGKNYAYALHGVDPTNGFHFYAVRRNGNGHNFDFFVDGAKKTTAYVGTIPNNPFTANQIGVCHAAYYWDGEGDEVRASNTDRSDAWIKATYESGRDHLLTFVFESPPLLVTSSPVPLLKVLDII